MVEALVLFVGFLPLFRGAFTRVLTGQEGDDDGGFRADPRLDPGQHHPRQPGVQRQCRQCPAQFCQREGAARFAQRTEFDECVLAVLDRPGFRWGEEREVEDVLFCAHKTQLRHHEQHAGEVCAQDLRVGVFGPGVEFAFRVQPDGDAVAGAAGPAGALPGRRLRDRLDRQALHFCARGVARDARRAAVDDVFDARNGQ